MGHNGFLNNVSIPVIDKARTQKIERISGGELWKPIRPFDLMLKTVSDQPHTAKNAAYGLYFYGIVWILVRQGPFMD